VSTKLPLPLGDLGPHVTGANMSACPKRLLHLFSHFSRQTHRQTDHATSVVRGHIFALRACNVKKGKGSPYSTAERRVPELIPVLGSQPAGDMSHKPSGRLPLLSVTLATLKMAATNFAAW